MLPWNIRRKNEASFEFNFGKHTYHASAAHPTDSGCDIDLFFKGELGNLVTQSSMRGLVSKKSMVERVLADLLLGLFIRCSPCRCEIGYNSRPNLVVNRQGKSITIN